MGLLCLLLWATVAGAEAEFCPLPGTNLSNWSEIYRKQGITVYSMETPDNAIMAFRAAGVLDAPIDQVLEVLRKVEIADEWMPDIVEKRTIQDISDLEAITYSINRLPWPFANRELIMKNALRVDTVNRYLVVDAYSVDVADMAPRKGTIRAYMHCGQTRLRPVDNRRTKMDIILFVDPRGAIPAWLANFAQRQMPYNFLRSLEEKAAATDFPLRPNLRRMLERLTALDSAETTASRAPSPSPLN
jgi:hypothetical protein